jgi:sugar phosphate isomerase/epimerase
MKKVFSLVGFHSVDAIKEFLAAAPSYQVELPYNMDASLLSQVLPLVKGRVASVHACCPNESGFPNFASSDRKVQGESMEMLHRSSILASSQDAGIVVVHPGYIVDALVPSAVKDRMAVLSGKTLGPCIDFQPGSICRTDYPHMDIYRSHFDVMRKHLSVLGGKMEGWGVRLAVENLNPRAGYLNMLPEEMVELSRLEHVWLCLDVGHLWVSHCRFGFDFLQGLTTILDTGKVLSCHLHANDSMPGNPPHCNDSHDDFDSRGIAFARDVVRTIAPYRPNLVLETLKNPFHNMEVLDVLLG